MSRTDSIFPAYFNLLMLSKKGYLVHFARLFFASLLYGICSFITHIWNIYQPIHLAFQLQRCPSVRSNTDIWHWLNDFHLIHLLPSFSLSSKCHVYIKNDYPLNIHKCIAFLHSILLIYLVYHLICLSLFHAHFQQLQTKQKYYAHRYCEDQKNRKSRCLNRLL